VEFIVILFIELIALASNMLAWIIGTVGLALAAIVLLVWLIRALFFRKSPQIDGADVISPADRVKRLADKEMTSTAIKDVISPADRVKRLADKKMTSTATKIEKQPVPAREAEPRKKQDQLSNRPGVGVMPNSLAWVLFVASLLLISPAWSHNFLRIFLLSVIALVVGIHALMLARTRDRKNYVIKKATPMSLAMVNERDDVWLKGITECESPLIAPYFNVPCLSYDYARLKRVTRTVPKRKASHFETKKDWETVEEKSEDTSLFLRDGEHVIDIDGNAGDLIDHRESDYERIGEIAHTLKYVPHPLELSAVGSISEGKHRLEEHANIPLLVTTRDRKGYMRAAEDDERKALYIGLVFSWFGLAGLFGLFVPGPWLWASLPAIIVTLYWGILKHNILVDYRNRVENAWQQVDVDLTMRYQLIPNLVASVKGAMNYERKSITRLVKLRTKAIANKEDKLCLESEIVESVRTIVARIERYPNLTAQGTIERLIRELCAIEEKIAHGRAVYNDAVHEYNNNVSMFPQKLIAEKFGFESHQFFTIPAKEVALPDANWG
jgi:LemA protein